MKINMGTLDRMLRVMIAAILAAFAYAQIVTDLTAAIFFVIAGVLALTSLVGYCPLYALLGVHTSEAHT